jgi:PAS domain S-box-containing protein
MSTITPDLSAVLDLIDDSVTVRDASGRLVYANAAARQMGFATTEDLLASDGANRNARYTVYDEHGQLFPWDRLPERRVLAGQDAPDVLLRYHDRATGEERWVVAHAAPLKSVDGVLLAVNVIRDVADSVRTEAVLREREARLRAVLAAMPDLMFVQATDGTYLEFHADDDNQLFVPPAAFLGKKPTDVLTPDVAAAVMPALEHTAQTGELTSVDYILPMDNEERHYEARIVRLDVSRVLSIVRDLTDRVRAEAALAERRRFEDRVAAASPAILYVYDTIQGRNVHVNQAVTRILGYDPDSFLDQVEPPFTALLHPEDQARLPEMAAQLYAAADGEIVEHAYRLRHANGQWRWLAARVTVMTRTPDGAPHLIVGAALDVTARREAQEALLASEARYRAVVEVQNEMVSRFLPDTTLTFVNEAYCRFFGRTKEELIGLRFIELDPPWIRETTLANIALTIQSADPVINEHEVHLADGSIRCLEWINSAIRDANGDVVELQGVGRDVTDLRRTEAALRESEARYREVVELQNDLVSRFLPDTTLTFVNEAYCRFFGRTKEELIGLRFIELDPPSTRETTLARIAMIGHSPEPVTIEHEVYLPDGSIGWMQWNNRAIRDAAGNLIEIQTVGRDVTELRRAEEFLREQEAQLRLALDNAAMGTWDWTVDSGWAVWSEHSGPLYGLPAGTPGVTSEQFFAMVHPEDRARVQAEDEERMGDAGDYAVEFRVVWPDGTIHWLDSRGRAMARDAAGRVTRFLGVTLDVTARKQTETTLRRLTQRLMEAQDDERRRLARDLHDGVAQDVFGVTFALASIEKATSLLDPRSQVALAEAQALAEQALRALRMHAYLLHPPLLDMVGLAPALREYAAGLARRGEFEVDASAVEDVERLPTEVETALFRVAQEALANVAKHAATDRASLTLRSEGDMVELRIADQGKGRTSAEVLLGVHSLGVGIPGMRERLRQIGGELEIASGPGWTTVTARTSVTLGTT